jgi:hypothetical protein
MADRLRPLKNENRIIARAQIFGRKRGETKIRNFGDHTGINLNLSREKAEDWSNDTPVKQKVGSATTQKSGTLTFGLKQWTPDNAAMIFGGKTTTKVNQVAIANAEFEFENVVDGDILELLYVDEDGVEHRVYDVTSITAAGWAEGESKNFVALNAIGLIQVIKAPATSMSGTFSAASSERKQFGLQDEDSWIGEIWINQIHTTGPKLGFYLPFVDGGADSDVAIGADGTEYTSGSMSFDINADTSQPAGFEYGYITSLDAAA